MDIAYVLHMRKLLRLPQIMQMFDQFTRVMKAQEENHSRSSELNQVFVWHSLLSAILMMIFLRLDCYNE